MASCSGFTEAPIGRVAMKPPELSLERLAQLSLPHLDPAALDLRRARRDPSRRSFEWLERIRSVSPPRGPRPREEPRRKRGEKRERVGPIEVISTRERVAVELEGGEDWVIDAAQFAGTSVSVTVQNGGVEIALTDALYPGTTIPADLKARIWLENGVWMLRLRLKFGGFDATLPFLAWLAGTQLAVSDVDLDLTCVPLGATSELAARGTALAVFTPGWFLGVWGTDVLAVAGLDGEVTADVAVIALLGSAGPQVVLPTTQRRTLILLGSLEQFPVVPDLGAGGPDFELDDFRFDGLWLEAGIDPANASWRVLIARSVADPTTLGMVPGGDLRGGDGRRFRIGLSNPLYVVLYDEARAVVAAGLLAQGPVEPAWMHCPTCSLLLSQSRTKPLIGALAIPGHALWVDCSLRLEQTAFHLPGLLVTPKPALRIEVLFSWKALTAALPPRTVHVEVDRVAEVATVRMPTGATTSVVRRDDLLVAGFEFLDLAFEGRAQVGRFSPVPGKSPHLVVLMPPQSIAEAATFEVDDNYDHEKADWPKPPPSPKPFAPDTKADKLPLPPVPALLAKSSRLVFEFPAALGHLALSPAELLDWNRLVPSLAPTALPGVVTLARPDGPSIVLPGTLYEVSGYEAGARTRAPAVTADSSRLVEQPSAIFEDALHRRPIDIIRLPRAFPLRPSEPKPIHTAIEAPFRLLMSPNLHGAWVHAPAPVTRDGRTELWHTRLGVRHGDEVSEKPHEHRTLRAIWSRDHDVKTAFNRPFLISLDQDDRRQLVHLSSDYGLPVPPRPVGVRVFMLSALGAWLDTEFGITPPKDYSIEEWRHRATLGRDHYVRVVYKGFLFPFGHRASLVKITERKIETAPDGVPTAYLRQRMFIVVRERERTYPPVENANAYKHGGRETPLRRVRITTTVTPNLNPPQQSLLGTPVDPPMKGFWPRVGSQDFLFHLRSWDWEGREVDFLSPLAFVRADHGAMEKARDDYNKSDPARRTVKTGGQLVALAESDAGSLGKTSVETVSLSFQVLAPFSGGDEPPCYPRLEQAAVFMPPLRQVGGVNPATLVTIDPYVTNGFGTPANRAKVFAKVLGAAPSLDYTGHADKSGGVATPSLVIRALSRELGVVGDDSPGFAAGTFTPANFFPGNAKLLGGIGLADILDKVLPADFLDKTPALVTENTPTAVRTVLDWETSALVKSGVFLNTRQTKAARLALHSELTAPKSGAPPVFKLSGVLTDFTIDFAEVIEVGFQRLSFEAVNGKKPDVHVLIDQKDVLFKGPLAFVQTIKDNLNLGGFTDPPFLDVGPTGVLLGYTQAIPTVAVGVFSLQNLGLGARLMLPFTGEPIRLRFNLSERQNPFLVSVAPFGGGGFFALAVGIDGVELLEVSIEFGGNIAVDLGVASGGVYVMAGIYIKIKLATPDSCAMTGYVRMGGYLSVIGLISITIEFYIGLTYAKPKAWGEARVTVQVKLICVSKSVTVTARKQFAGSAGDPPFGELMPAPRWAEYAAAFA
jgi:hypothetical protein